MQFEVTVPTFEDKVAQRAIVMVLEAVYEQDFLPCSFGFRPGRSAHQAVQFLRTACMSQRLRWVLDIDIEKYFDSIPHSHLRDFLDRRVTDGVIRRMIDKWLKAGVLEDGLLRHATEGSPQGGVISPCLSNIFLHHVLDEWFEFEVRPRLKGRCTLIRFADDAVMAFEEFLDALRRFPQHSIKWDMPSGGGWDLVHLPRLYPHLGQVAGRQECGAARHGQEPLRPRAGGGDGLVSVQPASADPRPARPSDRDDAGPLCLLRHNRQLSTPKLVRPSGRDNLAEVAVAAGP